MSINTKRPKTCTVPGCTRGVCAANIDLCHEHYQQARALAEAESRDWHMHQLGVHDLSPVRIATPAENRAFSTEAARRFDTQYVNDGD